MKRKWFLRALGLFFVGGICWLLVGITINFPPKSPVQKLNESRALWEAKGIKNYQMDISFSSFSFIGGYHIVVRDNQVTQFGGPTLFDANSTPPPANSASEKFDDYNPFGKLISSEISDYTVDNLFDVAAEKLKDAPVPPLVTWCGEKETSPIISFDNELSYIQAYTLSSCPDWQIGAGLLCPRIGDCYAGLKVRNFQILPPS